MSEQLSVAAAAQPLGVYAPMKQPASIGELRSRTWRLPIFDAKAESSPIWMKRAQEYWERQERKYGLVMSDFTLTAGNFPETGPVITTFSVVLEVLPGRRDPALALRQ